MYNFSETPSTEYYCSHCGFVYEASPRHPAEGEKCYKCKGVLYSKGDDIKPEERQVIMFGGIYRGKGI
ncbi:hypothetical protein CNH03415 [Cryptococcus deneoformans JEC21]|uniref:Rubredoxin-like domain-containing protein n=1 Tax=Cryptococcus deneoformans (strain JEC21 / ATCC MYA-565) TaxID=214684 RepID=A0A0S2M5S2_CRYD1|nr:hypothetical protein CNH03415 [Cryptococcus neoformans var. neoformans JEC21]ALO69504.1 hypothetical protein CNH03415 [Cryptococcus neoformans var. neoformans JEC21]